MKFNFILENQFVVSLWALPILLLANNLWGGVLAKKKGTYKKEILIEGIKKGVVVYFGILLYALVSFFVTDLKVEFSGEVYTLTNAMYLIIWTTVGAVAAEGVAKLKKIFDYKVNEEERFD